MSNSQAHQASLTFHREQFYREVGARIRVARENKGLTQDAVASSVGLSRTSLTNIERGRQKILLHTLSEIASALSADASELFPAKTSSFDVIHVKLPSKLPQPQKDFVQRALNPVINNEESTLKPNQRAGKLFAEKARSNNGSHKR